jgi:hypothetical protein
MKTFHCYTLYLAECSVFTANTTLDNLAACCSDAHLYDFMEKSCVAENMRSQALPKPQVNPIVEEESTSYETVYHSSYSAFRKLVILCDTFNKQSGDSFERRWSYISCAQAPVVYQHWVDDVLLPDTRRKPILRLTFTPQNHTVRPHRLHVDALGCSRDDLKGLYGYQNCLLDSECQVGSATCPYTGVTCQGQETSGNKCLFYVQPDAEDQALGNTAADMCARRGGHLPVLRTKGEVSDLRLLLYYSRHYAKTQKLCASLQSNVSWWFTKL